MARRSLGKDRHFPCSGEIGAFFPPYFAKPAFDSIATHGIAMSPTDQYGHPDLLRPSIAEFECRPSFSFPFRKHTPYVRL